MTRISRHQRASAEALRMMQLGESGRFEFKENAEAVSVGVLAAMANWVAADDGRSVVKVLVGVKEVEDRATGLVRGEPCGLPKGLDRAVARIQDLASKTRPIPIDIFIVEEAVAGDLPFLRLEIRPTMAPHFDDEGRRQTRQGRSTRALTDEELLQIYLNRETSTFAARYRQIANDLKVAVGDVGAQVDSIASAIETRIARPIDKLTIAAQYAGSAASSAESAADDAASAAMSAESAASEVGEDVRQVEFLVEDLRRVVESTQEESAGSLAARVISCRRKIWWAFTTDTWHRESKQAEKIAGMLHRLLSSDVSVDGMRNAWELQVWDEVLKGRSGERRKTGSLKWWSEAVARIRGYFDAPSYSSPALPDLRAEIRAAGGQKVLDNPASLTTKFLVEAFPDRVED